MLWTVRRGGGIERVEFTCATSSRVNSLREGAAMGEEDDGMDRDSPGFVGNIIHMQAERSISRGSDCQLRQVLRHLDPTRAVSSLRDP